MVSLVSSNESMLQSKKQLKRHNLILTFDRISISYNLTLTFCIKNENINVCKIILLISNKSYVKHDCRQISVLGPTIF